MGYENNSTINPTVDYNKDAATIISIALNSTQPESSLTGKLDEKREEVGNNGEFGKLVNTLEEHLRARINRTRKIVADDLCIIDSYGEENWERKLVGADRGEYEAEVEKVTEKQRLLLETLKEYSG